MPVGLAVRISARDITYAYPRCAPVLRGVDFDIPAGAAAAIVGPSGSGKTTLLSLLGKLLETQAGSIGAFDATGTRHEIVDVSSWVLQTVSLLPDRSVADNVAIGAYSDGVKPAEARARAEHYLAQVGLTGRDLDPARILSGGEAQRVAIARALASERPMVLADEPTGQLDASTSAVVLDAMISAHGDRTVVIVTHDAAVAEQCSIVLELRDGRIVEGGAGQRRVKRGAPVRRKARS